MRVFRRGTLVSNAVFNLLSWSGNALVNLISIPFIVHYLGAEGFGIYALITGLVGYYNLLDLGLGQGVVKFVAQFSRCDERNRITEVVNSALMVQLLTGLIGLLCLTTWNSEIIQLLKISSAQAAEASLCLYIGSVGFFVSMIMGTFSSALLGMQRFDVVGMVNVGFSILTTLLIVISLVLGATLFHVIFVTVILTVFNCITFIALVRRAIPSYRPMLFVKSPFLREIFSYSSYLFVLKLSSSFNTYFVRFILGALCGPQTVAYLVVPMKLVSAVQGGLGSLAGVMFPRSSELFASGSSDELRRIYLKGSRYLAAASTPLFMSLIFFAGPIMTIWMGAEFAALSWQVLVFLAIAYWLAVLTMLPGNVAMGIGKSRALAAFSGIATVLGLVFVPVLSEKYGAGGAAAGVMITAIQGPIFIWYVTSILLKIRWSAFTAEVFGRQAKPFWVLTLTCLGVVLFSKYVTDMGSSLTLITGGTIAALYVWHLFRSGVLAWNDIMPTRIFIGGRE